MGTPILKFDYSGTGAEEIRRNVRTILGIYEGTMPMNRNLGIDSASMDVPIDVAQNRMTVDLIEKIEKYEPRVRVQEVGYQAEQETGELRPVISLLFTGANNG